MANLYSREWLQLHTPSRVDGFDASKEENLKRKSWNLIKQMGTDLKL
jgi:hypothetical protein